MGFRNSRNFKHYQDKQISLKLSQFRLINNVKHVLIMFYNYLFSSLLNIDFSCSSKAKIMNTRANKTVNIKLR
jgi:hypothetical protein